MRISKATISLIVVLMACGEDDPVRQFSISGVVREGGQGISGVSILNNDLPAATTSNDGSYRIDGLAPGNYVIKAEQAGRAFTPADIAIDISASDTEGNDFERLPVNQIVHQGQTWNLFNPAVYSVKANNATSLQLDLEQNALWYQASQGGLIYRTITGDFTITARVKAVRKSDNSQAVACDVCLGGLMARNPSGTQQNYVHLVTGFTPDGLGYETKNTSNNVSPYEATGDGNSRHDLRINRSGNTFTLYQKLTTETNWNIAATYNRPDLPATLQVGFNIYTAQSGAVADLSVIYENVVIE